MIMGIGIILMPILALKNAYVNEMEKKHRSAKNTFHGMMVYVKGVKRNVYILGVALDTNAPFAESLVRIISSIQELLGKIVWE